MKTDKKILIVGAGFSGAVIARYLADHGDFSIQVIDKRRHVGGNSFSQRDPETGIMIHTYGPHILNTDMQHVWDYVNRFSSLRPYTNRVKASVGGGVYSLPINLHTINQLFSKQMNPREAEAFISGLGDRTIGTPSNFEEQALKMMGHLLYETFFLGYTKKQWGRDPRELPSSILKRLPIRFNYDDNYYTSRLQGIPDGGYGEIFERMLSHPAITVSLGTTYTSEMSEGFGHTFYTGAIDGYFNYKYGRLQYRTVRFERIDAVGDFQGNAVINYTGIDEPYTRIHEHKHFTPWEKHAKTVAFREYSLETGPEDEPYYPVRSADDIILLEKYQAEARKLVGKTFIGRLATYRYLDMDDVIDEALRTAETYIRQLSNQ